MTPFQCFVLDSALTSSKTHLSAMYSTVWHAFSLYYTNLNYRKDFLPPVHAYYPIAIVIINAIIIIYHVSSALPCLLFKTTFSSNNSGGISRKKKAFYSFQIIIKTWSTSGRWEEQVAWNRQNYSAVHMWHERKGGSWTLWITLYNPSWIRRKSCLFNR